MQTARLLLLGGNSMNNLRELRKENGYSQEQMAAELGVSLSMYQKVEQGNAKAGRNFMEKIKQRFPEASIDYIFFASNSNFLAIQSA
jgi:transcriptional regulator with XRE-family HTH domain